MENYQDQEPLAVCFYCDTSLDDTKDYSCVKCGRLTCDNHNVACQDCDFNACSACMASHLFGRTKLTSTTRPRNMAMATFNAMVVADIEWIVERLAHLSARIDRLYDQD